jgi:hypothetical protein
MRKYQVTSFVIALLSLYLLLKGIFKFGTIEIPSTILWLFAFTLLLISILISKIDDIEQRMDANG